MRGLGCCAGLIDFEALVREDDGAAVAFARSLGRRLAHGRAMATMLKGWRLDISPRERVGDLS